MVFSTASFSAAAIAAIGALVFWSNPHRLLNRFFLTQSVHIAGWLMCVHFAVTRHEDPAWIRAASIVAAFCPPHIWLLKQIYANGAVPAATQVLRRLAYWIAGAAVLVGISCTDWYVSSNLPGTPPRFGAGAIVYIVLAIVMYGIVLRQTIDQIRKSSGGPRLELQILLLGLSAAALAILGLMAIRVVTRAVWPIHVQPIALLLVYSATLVLVTTHRIFDARQISIWALEKLSVAIVGLATLFATESACRAFSLPASGSLLVVVVTTLGGIVAADRQLQKWFRFFPRAGEARRAVFAASEREVRWDRLQVAFQAILRGWGQTEKTLLNCGPRTIILNSHKQLRSGIVVGALTELHWATPERLVRERPTPARTALADYMRSEELGIVVLVQGSVQLALVGVGVSGTRMPYTYPQAMELLEIASIMEGAFERVQLSAKVQHSEQLAMVGMVGASLAHEIRNPLVAIRTFVQMLPRQHENPEFREKFFHVVDEEVQRIEQLARQFLELSAPRDFKPGEVKLHSLIAAGLELVAPKAAQKGIRVLAELNAAPDVAFTDAGAAKQVLLNLSLNAIQALESSKNDRREVTVRTRNIGARIEMSVSDTGPGISSEVLSHLFEPFQTTKESGFGLGLAVCSDVLAKLDATIAVDPLVPGQGATFRVAFPAQLGSA